MKISEKTISALAQVITGNSNISPYRSGPELVKFFNELSSNEVYGADFGSRVPYTEDKIWEVNGSPNLVGVFHNALNQKIFLETEFQIEQVVDYLNQYLEYEATNIKRDSWTKSDQRFRSP